MDCGNSGTLARLLIGILSTTPNIEVKVRGDDSLNRRNMRELIDIMSDFGAEFLPSKKYKFPLNLISSEIPIGIEYKAGVSAQLKSAVILAGLNSYGKTKISESHKSRNHTENMLRNNLKVIKIKEGNTNFIEVFGKRELKYFCALFDVVTGHRKYAVNIFRWPFLIFRTFSTWSRDTVNMQ